MANHLPVHFEYVIEGYYGHAILQIGPELGAWSKKYRDSGIDHESLFFDNVSRIIRSYKSLALGNVWT
jgi:hypothetical protein